jgi:hypothetical protein
MLHVARNFSGRPPVDLPDARSRSDEAIQSFFRGEEMDCLASLAITSKLNWLLEN